ncbi:MAG: peptidylprolyl isomerase [Rhodobacteraceae bacterium]|nr:peptidylprolyl isomerase [Paracoccaceae bacterium]
MRTFSSLISALVVSVGISLPAQAQDASTVVATVDGVEITLGHMIVARATLPQQYQQLPDDVLFDGILQQLIQQAALAADFKGDLPPRVTLSIENETRSLIAGESIEMIMAGAVTDDAVNALYQSEYVDAEQAVEYNASHILVETEEQALAIAAEVRGGADFAETAKEKSTGPSGPGGGSLGWFGKGAMVAPFENAVVSMEVGAVSDPVQTQFGWHVIKLNETRTTPVPDLEEVRGEIEAQVQQQAAEAAMAALVEAADVDQSGAEGIDPLVLRNLSLVD